MGQRPSVRATLAGALVVAALLAGCAGDDGQSSPSAQSAPDDAGEAASSTPLTAASAVTTPVDVAPRSGEDPSPGEDPPPAGGSASPPGPADVPVRDAAPAAPRPEEDPPVRVTYEALGIDMSITPVGVEDDGQMEIPYDAAEAGWYEFGPTVGADEGTAVIAAHAGSDPTPYGPFYDLQDATVGDVITVDRADGTAVTYEVASVESIGKDVIDMSLYFRQDGDPGLVLFTCGGRWDDARQSYDDNIVVVAVPVR